MDAYLLVTCPYNSSHRIAKYKFMNHVAKCKKSSKVVNKTECPIDRTHIVNQADLQEHIKSCPSLGKLAGIEYEKPKFDVNPPLLNTYSLDENWEEDPEVPAYNPMEASAKKPVLRCISGLTKSERKKFKEDERKRISMLKNMSYENKPSSSVVQDMVNEVPLRLPRNPTSADVSQNNCDDSTEMSNQDSNDSKINMEATFLSEFQNNLYHKLMYDELAPENDNYAQAKQINQNSDKKISASCLSYVNQEADNFSVSTESQEPKFKKTKTLDLFNNLEREKQNECNPSTSTGERVTNKLLALLKSESNMKKLQSKQEVPMKQNEGLPASYILNNMNERLTYLNGIQNAAAKESARILEQLKELKLYEESMKN